MISASPSKSLHLRRTQSTNVDFSTDDSLFRRSHETNLTEAPSRLDSIFRSRPSKAMSPIGTRKLLPSSSNEQLADSDDIPSIRPSLSCPAAVFESPLRNLLPPSSALEGIHDDPLEVSAIEFDDESVIHPCQVPHPSSEVSFPRNLNDAFDLLVPAQNKPLMISIENISVPRISLPPFRLSPSLSGSLSPGLMARVSFYSVVRDINAEASHCLETDPHGREVVAGDGRVHVHPTPEEEGKSVLFGNECHFSTNLLVDEEWFLLSAIASRSPEEIEGNIEQLLPTFAEAMGETKEESAGSRTQLWKPGRSWWEAKSGKNPWVEPVVHNNRWRLVLDWCCCVVVVVVAA
jgi:hypothetical protein